MKNAYRIFKTRILYIVVFILTVNFTFGQGNSLSVASDSEPFILYLNSKAANSTANQAVIAPGLNIGKNHVRLSFSKKGIPELNAQIEIPNDGNFHQLAYKVVRSAKGPYSLVFVSDLTLGQNSTANGTKKDSDYSKKSQGNPGKQTSTNKDNKNNANNSASQESGNQNVNINVTTTDTNVGTNVSTSSTGTNPNNGQINITINASETGLAMNSTMQENNSTQKKNENPYAGRVPQVANGLACANPSVNSQAFMQLKYKISQVYLDMNKAKEAKDFMNTNCMTSAQVADLVKLMQMADTQLDVAQFGFMHTYDQAKYEIVVNALMADYNKEKLLGFIGSYDGSSTTTQTSTNQSTTQNQTINYSVTMNVPQTTEVVTTSTTTETRQSNAYQSYNASSGCTPMDADEFEEMLEAADEPINEDKKMEVVKSVFDDKCLNTTQVASIVDLFINEDRKLDVAKWAFSRTSDKDKYFRINKAFINEQRKAELSQFVKDNK